MTRKGIQKRGEPRGQFNKPPNLVPLGGIDLSQFTDAPLAQKRQLRGHIALTPEIIQYVFERVTKHNEPAKAAMGKCGINPRTYHKYRKEGDELVGIPEDSGFDFASSDYPRHEEDRDLLRVLSILLVMAESQQEGKMFSHIVEKGYESRPELLQWALKKMFPEDYGDGVKASPEASQGTVINILNAMPEREKLDRNAEILKIMREAGAFPELEAVEGEVKELPSIVEESPHDPNDIPL